MDIGSMNFDVQQHDDDEEELLREEEEQKAELQARLANAFDDLLDDTDTSGSSGALDSHNTSLDTNRNQPSDGDKAWNATNQHPPNQHPPNQMPAEGYDPRFPPPVHFMPNYGAPAGGYEYHSSQGEGDPVAYSPLEGHNQFPGPYPAGPYYDGLSFPAISSQFMGGFPPGYHGEPGSYDNGYHGDHNGYYGYNSDGYHGSGDGYHIGSSQDEPDGFHSDHEQLRYHGYETKRRSSAVHCGHDGDYSELVPKTHSRSSTTEDNNKSVKQKVKYIGPVKTKNSDDIIEDKSQSADRSENVTPTANEQRQFIEAAGTPDTRTLAQLRILYKAQARTIDELKDEIKNNQEEHSREMRMLQHKIALLQGDKDGLMATLDHNQTLVAQTQAELLQLKTKLNEAENKIASVTKDRDDVQHKLDHAETNIDDLNQQLLNLGKSDTLARQRDRQETMMKCMQQKHQHEVLTLKEKLDSLSKELSEKTSECASVREQFHSVMAMSDQANLGHVQTVQTLTQSLQEALRAGSGVELARVQNELKQCKEKQQMDQEMYDALQEELNELKEQLVMYESASQFGVFPISGPRSESRGPSPVPMGDNQSDSFIQLNIKNQNNVRTSAIETHGKADSDVPEDEIGARLELKRCLQNYRHKQMQLAKSQSELRAAKREYMNCKSEKERLSEDNQKLTAELEVLRSERADGSSPKAIELEKQLATLKHEKSQLQSEIENLKERIAELVSSEERLTEVNAHLSTEMAQFIRDYDTSQQEEVQRCQATYQQHYEESKERIKQDLIANFNDERRKLIQMYEHQMEKYKSENEYLTKELMSIKEMYISMCHEKDEVADTVHKQCVNNASEKLEKVREECRQAKESELTKLRQSLQETYRVQLATAKEQWLRESESQTRRKIEVEISAARLAWFEEHRSDRQTSVDTALRTAKDEWSLNHDKDLRQKLLQAEESWRSKQTAEIEAQVHDLVAVECEKLNLKHRAEVEAMRQRMDCEKTKFASQAVSKAKADWTIESDRVQNDIKQKLKATLEEEFRLKFEKQLAKCLSDAREKWLSEKQNDLHRLVDAQWSHSEQNVREEYLSRVGSLEQALEEARSERHRLDAEVTSIRRAAQDEQQTLVKMKDLEICSLKAKKDRLEQDVQNAKRQAITDREKLICNHESLIARKDNELKTLKNINNMLEAELKGLKIENETALGQCESLKLRNENLEKEFVTAKGTWLAETESVIREKDQEQANSVQSLNEKHRQEIEKLRQEHSDILGQALRAAKEEMEKEKADLTSVYEQELQRLRERERHALENLVDNPSDKSIIQEMEDNFTRERTDVDQSWCRRITSVQSRYEREKKDLVDDWQKRCDQLLHKYQSEVQTRDQLETLAQELRTALNKERNQDKKWEQKLAVLREAYEREKDVLKASHREDLSRTVEVLKRKKDSEHKILTEKWEKSVNELRNEIKHRDKLLKQADEHLESEVEKLRQTMQEEHDHRLDEEIHELHERFNTEFSQATKEERLASQRQLDEAAERVLQSERHYESVIQTYQDKLSNLREELEAKIMDLRTDLEQRQIDLDQRDADYRRQMTELKTSLECEYNAVIESCEQEKNEFATKLELCQEQLQRVRSEKDNLEHIRQSCERHLADLEENERRHENEVQALYKKHEGDMSDLRRRLEEHHSTSVQAMKSKVMELRKNHAVAIETMKAQLTAEQTRDYFNKQIQTEEIYLEKELIDDIRTQYLDTVNRIRADVLRHVSSTNQRAAQNVRAELKKGQLYVAKRYKEHYVGCMKQILQQTNSSDVELKLSSFDYALSKPVPNLNVTQQLDTDQSAFDSQHSQPKQSNQRENHANTDFSLDDDYIMKSDDKLQSLDNSKTEKKKRPGSPFKSPVDKSPRCVDNYTSGRDISKSSEKYPIRNISPRRYTVGNKPAETDAQRPSRDMTSGYRSSSYLSMDTDVSGHRSNDTPGGGQNWSKNASRYKYTSLRHSIETADIFDVARQPKTTGNRGCYSNQNTPTDKVIFPRNVRAAPKYGNSNGSVCNSGPSNGRHHPAERLNGGNESPSDDNRDWSSRNISEKSKAPSTTRMNGYRSNDLATSPSDRVVKPVPLCTRQTQVPSR